MNLKLTRRQVLSGAALAAAGVAGGVGTGLTALASVTVGPHLSRTGCDTLVVIFLRGGADGLNLVAPYGDDDYYRLRPTLALGRPNDRREAVKARALDLDGFYGLHPSLAPLLPIYKNGQLAVVHAVGSGDQTLSHFEAMATMERGLYSGTGTASGWLARHLNATAGEHDPPLRAVALSETLPDSLRGTPSVTALTSLAEYRLIAPTGTNNAIFHGTGDRTAAIQTTLHSLYGKASGTHEEPVGGAGQETLAALEAVRRLDPAHYLPTPGVRYPKSDLSNALRQAACLIKGEVGLEVAALDIGGWDTHVAQGRDIGWQPYLLDQLGSAMAAFAADLGPQMAHVTTLVMTEFGRRAYENTGLGTDHGHGSCMFLMGGGVVGGKVHARWPGLSKEKLTGPGDLVVTTDYRDVLAEVLANRLHNPHLAEVFPDYTPASVGILRAVK